MVLASMLMIFIFSEESGEQSAETSGGVIKDVLDVFMPEEDITEEVIKKYQFPFRKIAHFGIFMLLGFCLANAFRNTINLKLIYTYIFSFGSVVLYASLDELHQELSVNRGPSFKDVLIDSLGGLVGVCLFALMIYLFNKVYIKKIRHWRIFLFFEISLIESHKA